MGDVYESAFESQKLHEGNGHKPVSDISERRAWEEQGFQLACWLVLQDQVDEVANETLEQKEYVLKDNLEMVFWDFLMT